MRSPFHDGELAVQARAGFLDRAASVGRSIGSTMPHAAAAFLEQRPMVVIAAADATGTMWASMLTGPPGFAHAVSDDTVEIDARPISADPLSPVLEAPARVGLIAIDPSRRRRIRINGRMAPTERGLRLVADQIYANCPKYIQRRHLDDVVVPSVPRPMRGTALTEEQQRFVAEADTFFVASRSADGDSDASHRGGSPGFIEVLGPTSLRWPDYFGNSMMMTLGNLQQDPAAGLLIVDWTTGRTLQLAGSARVDWDPASAARMPGAERVVDFELSEVLQVDEAVPLHWGPPEPSPANPSLE
jgi:predicted pyridoxine 5'-phosphate oxidase superfamily flavin-nucleotide-binding protein